MTKRYRGAVGVFALSLAAVAAIIGLLTPRISALPVVLFALAAYGVAVLLDVLPPGRPVARGAGGADDEAGAGALHSGPPQAPPRTAVERAAAMALSGVAVLMVLVTGFTAWQPGDDRLPELYLSDFAVPTSVPPTQPPGGHLAAGAEEGETPGPAAEPTPPATPTPAPTTGPTPEVPDSPFAYCTHLGGSRYSCGDQPWRVICAPDDYFFDPEGVVPDPIPAAWEGWSETRLRERLEYIHEACE